MLSKYLVMGSLGVAVSMANAAEPEGQRYAELKHLLIHDCGSCHGMQLTGGLGPALTTAAVVDKSSQYLRNRILFGREGTPMPPFAGLLSEQDVDVLVDMIKTGAVTHE